VKLNVAIKIVATKIQKVFSSRLIYPEGLVDVSQPKR